MRAAATSAWVSALVASALAASLAATWRVPAATGARPFEDAPATRNATHPRQPVRLSLEPRALGDRLALTLRLERSDLYADLPAQLRLRLPPGTTLLAGRTEEVIAPGRVATMQVELQVEGIPAEDLVATIDIAGEGRTARGEARHRFGRPEPRLPDMPRLPEARVRGGGSLGTRIRVAPTPR